MDPQADREELLNCYSRQQFEAAVEAAENLDQWLHRGGFPPTTNQLIAPGDELHRVIARAVVQHVIASCK